MDIKLETMCMKRLWPNVVYYGRIEDNNEESNLKRNLHLKLGPSRFEAGVTAARTQHSIITMITTLQPILQWTPLRQFKYLESDMNVVSVLCS